MKIESKAYSQVSFIIGKMSKNMRNKIPASFISMIEENKDTDYDVNAESVSDLQLLNDTKKILSVIYTDYIGNEEERKIIKNKEKMIRVRREQEKLPKALFNNLG